MVVGGEAHVWDAVQDCDELINSKLFKKSVDNGKVSPYIVRS